MRPTRDIWAVWLLTLLGGLAVLGAATVLITDPCTSSGVAQACRSAQSRQIAGWVAAGGGVAATTGVLAGVVLTVLRWRGDSV